MPLPTGYKIVIGQRLVEDVSGQEFTILCSCPRSTPRSHTRRYIERNPEQFSPPVSRPELATNQ